MTRSLQIWLFNIAYFFQNFKLCTLYNLTIYLPETNLFTASYGHGVCLIHTVIHINYMDMVSLLKVLHVNDTVKIFFLFKTWVTTFVHF